MTDVILIHTTTDKKEAAQHIAQDLVQRQLAACVQIGGPITSIYRWKDQIESAEEWICAIKTTADLFPRVEHRIRQLHSYEEPEIVAINIAAASPGYLSWLQAQLTKDDEPAQ